MMTEKSIRTQRGDVYYWISNKIKGKFLVFLHGLTADHRLFDKQIPFFEGQYSLLCWDAPAHGRSRPYLNFSYANAAGDLKEILEAEKISSVVLIGQSMGGFVAQAFIRRFPSMVEAFIGIDTCPFGRNYYSRMDKWWLRQVEWMSMCYPKKLLVRAIASSCAYTNEGNERMKEMLAPYSKREVCRLMGIGFAGFLIENEDITISCPVLLLVGERDRTGKVKAYCKEWHKREGVPLIEIKDAAHNSNVDNSKAVNESILEFIEQLIREEIKHDSL